MFGLKINYEFILKILHASYPVHPPSMFLLFLKNQRSTPYFFSDEILLENVTLQISNFTSVI